MVLRLSCVTACNAGVLNPDRYRAATPAIIGVAMEVPLRVLKHSESGHLEHLKVTDDPAPQTSTPGAVRSTIGPWLDQDR